MSLERKTAEFVAAIIDEIVGDCIEITKDTGTWMFSNQTEMRDRIIKRLEEYKTGAVAIAADQVAA